MPVSQQRTGVKTVLEALGGTTMAKNTIVIFVSDHREYPVRLIV